MPVRVQLLGSTRLTRVIVPYLLERRGARVVGVDLGEEDESLPWFAPVRGLLRDNGIPPGRAAADLVLDLDPDARALAGEGFLVRLVPPRGARSADLNRALLGPGDWDVAVTDGRDAWACLPVEVRGDDDAATLLDRGTRRAVEALDAAWEGILAGAPPTPLPRPLVEGRWRAQESHILWEQPAERVVARIRACAGPWGGARTQLGETTVRLLDATLESPETPPDFAPGTLMALDEGLLVATGRGTVRVARLRPGWRPPRGAGGFARESGLSPGYQFS